MGLSHSTASHAGAWIAPEGGQEIWTNTFGQRDGLSYYESSTYWEVPLNDRLSVVAAPWVEQNYDTPDGWRGEATFGLKTVVARSPIAAFAVQGGAFWRSNPERNCGEGGVEARLLAGRNLGKRGFLNAEIAQRELSGGCGDTRLDLTAGFQLSAHWRLAGDVFVESGEGSATKMQISVIRIGDNRRGLQLGFRSTLDGEDPEPALVIAIWRKPGDR